MYFSNNFLKDSSKSLAVHHLLPRLSVLRIINLNLISQTKQTLARSIIIHSYTRLRFIFTVIKPVKKDADF